jgi:hypothetical protein
MDMRFSILVGGSDTLFSMSRRKEERIRATPRQRVSLILVGLILMAPALLMLAQGKITYEDYRGLLDFAPFGLLVGLVIIFFAFRIGKGK